MVGLLFRGVLLLYGISTFVEYLMPNLVYVCVYMWHGKSSRYRVTPPKKNRTHIFLTEIHKFNCSLFFFSEYEVDSVQEKLAL